MEQMIALIVWLVLAIFAYKAGFRRSIARGESNSSSMLNGTIQAGYVSVLWALLLLLLKEVGLYPG